MSVKDRINEASGGDLFPDVVDDVLDRYGYTILSFALGITLWETVVFLAPDLVTLAPPSAAAEQLTVLITGGKLWGAWIVSIQHMFAGYALAIVIAIPLGFMMARVEWIRWAVNPFIDALYSTPSLVFIPLIIVWFGLFFYARVAMVFLMCFFEILITTLTGVSSIDENYLDVARSFDLSWWDRQRNVLLPASLPHVFTGLHLGAGRAVRGMIVAEIFLALVGLGGLLEEAGQSYATDEQLAIIVFITLTGIAMQKLVLWTEEWTIPWSHTEEEE
jgi:ABC-type nitrate/sulfonate/bicarbonate transport system permease component